MEPDTDRIPHHWVPTTVGHGVMICSRCHMTMLEAAALGVANNCQRKEKE